jgi:glyoxylase-like metal-dependent hydrolase (beta-lactamase superfamily II)
MRFGAKKYLGFDAGPIPKVEKYLRSHEEIRLGELKLLIIHTPGHTPGSICLYHKNSQTLITGDLIFADGGVGRTDFPYSDLQKLNDSLNKIFKLPGNLIIYPGHGNSSLLEKEKNYYF